MLRAIARLFNPLPPLEEFAQSGWATTCSPDDIIVAALLESMAKEPDLWICSIAQPYRGYSIATIGQSNDPRKQWIATDDINPSTYRRSGLEPIEVIASWEKASRDKDGCSPWVYRTVNGGSVSVNRVISLGPSGSRTVSSVAIEATAGTRFMAKAKLLTEQRAMAEAVARQAKLAMEANEKKWIMAERLLGMKRNEHGALVSEVQEGEVK